jgi:hypothetical protein
MQNNHVLMDGSTLQAINGTLITTTEKNTSEVPVPAEKTSTLM